MSTVILPGRYEDDGTEIVVVRTIETMPGYPHLNRRPEYRLSSGEALTPSSRDSGTGTRVFQAIHSKRLVTFVG